MSNALTRCAAVAVLVAPLVTATPAVAAPSTLNWQPCRQVQEHWYPDDDRTECTTVTVPLDHSRPHGRKIDLAVSRIRATDPGKRRGVLLMNPGGPGNPGIGMPFSMLGTKLAELNADHDLIGFDPRATGASGGVECEATPADGPEPDPKASPEARFRQDYERNARTNARCTGYDRELLTNLSTRAVADDMDLIRAALGERKISFFGISWGTALGAVYRSHHDRHVDRMLLDSVMPADYALETMNLGASAAKQANYEVLAAWLAERDATAGLGGTAQAVTASISDLVAKLDAAPVTATPPGGKPREYSGREVRTMLTYKRAVWPQVAESVVALRDGGAPPLTGDEPELEGFGLTPVWYGGLLMQRAVMCNDQGKIPDVDEAWRQVRHREEKYPFFRNGHGYGNWCAGWPLPATPWELKRATSPLQLSGHRYETTTPLFFAEQMRRKIGGALLTVDDSTHGSLWFTGCAEKAVRFYRTGETSSGSCPGVS
ncbi:alpha/beta fold hydrolase [Lentzea cavernae]|uniref:Alpha/beta hydrolase n=1 Tax=Lentzea cavernae TaxID=2020703 RepID=A0ABQ3MES0_9PSEU|nr:alpha/beta fold hydrolase [Lentzea cavernae]GHH41057.1 alpha/beta hydrolase [Lentzea cavernae]